MPRGRKKKFKLSRIIPADTLKSLVAVMFLLVSGLSLISFFAGDYFLNAKIQIVLKGLFGGAAILTPFVFFILGLLLIDTLKLSIKNPRILFGLLGLLFSFSALFHIFHSPDAALEAAREGAGGGLVGYYISTFLREAISIYGGILVLISIIIVSFLLVFNLSFDQIIDFFLDLSETFKEKGYAEAFKSIFRKKKAPGEGEGEGDNISVSSGSDVLKGHPEGDEDTNDFHGSAAVKKPAKIEIIPSMSEPQALSASKDEGSGAEVSSLVPNLPYSDRVWEPPPLDLLAEAPDGPVDRGDTKGREKAIIDTLKSFGINVKVYDVKYGPSVTQYSLEAESGTRIARISSLQNDLAMATASLTGSVRIEAPIPGTHLIGIEIPNNVSQTVNFKSLLTSEPMKALKSKLGIVLGKDVAGQTRVYDISRMPHLLVAGATGSGKSVFLHSVIFSILYRASPAEVKFIMMDPKRTELIHYQDIPHLITPVITDVEKSPAAFKWAVAEMERRYKLFEDAKARNIESYNEMSGFNALEYVVIVVDELAEIMIVDPASVEKSIIRIAQLARATGIHLVLAVQRPSTNIITGLIKANIPSRIAFNVASQIDSRVIIDQPGAEKLLGKGDMLFIPPDAPKPTRLQGSFISDSEISQLVGYLKGTGVVPEYKKEIFEMADKPSSGATIEGEELDPLFNEAVETVMSSGKASASLLQRRLSVGYARAARIIDQLEQEGIVGPQDGAKPRQVLISGKTSSEFEFSESSDPPEPEKL
jgi:DNA segregation ATPase FtsK/SpoIIIE, S-DNA-T family